MEAGTAEASQEFAAHPFRDIDPARYPDHRREIEARHVSGLLVREPVVAELHSWNGDVSARRLRIESGDLVLECFGTPSDTKRLFVFLNGGGRPLGDAGWSNFPRASWHPWLDGIGLNIDDPTYYAFPGELKSGWYLGSERSDGVAAVAATVRKVQERYSIKSENVVFVGSSSGGTAALKIAAATPGALAVAENPPFYPHLRDTATYFARVGLDLNDPRQRRRNDLRHVLDHPHSRFFVLQNAADVSVAHQLDSFASDASLRLPRFGLNEYGSLSVYCANIPTVSPHHAFLQVEEFLSVVVALDRTAHEQTRSAVLDAVHSSLRARSLATDQIWNLKAWANMFAELDIPALADPPAARTDSVIRIPLRDDKSIKYRLRLSHKARDVFMAVDVKPGAVRVTEETFETIVKALGARVSESTDGRTVSVANVPVEMAAERLKVFVNATRVFFS